MTDSQGHYSFCGVSNGSYSLTAKTNHPAGGVNSSDAVQVLEYFVGMSELSGLNALAADVNGNQYINTTDAFEIQKKYLQMMMHFKIGDWIFEEAKVTVFGTAIVTKDIGGICTGDVNASYIP